MLFRKIHIIFIFKIRPFVLIILMKNVFEVFIQLLNLVSKSSTISLLRNFSKASSYLFINYFFLSHFPVVNIHKSKSIAFKVLLVALLFLENSLKKNNKKKF